MDVRVTRLFLGVILATVPFWTQHAQAQVTLSKPAPELTVTANQCPVAPCTALVDFEVKLEGARPASVVLAFTPASGLGFVQSLCTPADDIEGIPGCPSPPIPLKRTLNIPVGSWNVVVRVLRNNRRETTGPTHFTVSAPTTVPPGPVSLLRVEANEGFPGLRVRKPSPAWPTGIVSESDDQVKIIGRNLNNNSFLKVYLAPRPNGEADLIASSALPIPTWCLFEAQILSSYGLKDGNSVLNVKMPELPLTVPSECLPSPVSVGSIYNKRWRWVIEDRWNRPEGVHAWWAIPSPRLTDPSYGFPSFEVTPPPYPRINGFGFENEGTPASYNEFLTVYGNNAYLCSCIPVIGCACIPDPLYLLWWLIYKKAIDSADGSCNGMASTSLLMARGDWKTERFNADVLSPYGFTANDQSVYSATYKDTNWCTPFCSPPQPDNLWAHIRMNHGVQMSREFLEELLDTVGEAVFDPRDLSTFKGVPNETLERVRKNPQGYVICFTNLGGGHCVTPYEVVGKSIHVYDNNNPGDLKRQINIVGGDYDYPARRREKKHPNRGNGIFAYPISLWQNPRHMLGLNFVNDALDFLSLFTVGNADMTVTNKKGGRWGWEDNGKFSDSYSGALAIPLVGMRQEKSPTMPLMIAMNQPAPTIRINARGGQYFFHTGVGGHLFQIEASHAQAGDKDQVRLNYAKEDLASFAFTPQRDAGNFVPRVGLEISGEESGVFHWIGLKVPRGKTIQIGGDRKSKSVNYRNDTGAATQHLLILDAGARAHTRMIYGPFEVPSGATQRIVLKHWPDTSTVVSELDLNGDGTTDQTAVVTGNRANPPTPAGGFADLTIERTIAPESFNVGQEASYSLQVVNKGSHNATSVLLTSSFSNNVELSAISSSKGRCTASRGRLTCEIGGLAIGQSATISYRVKANRRGLLTNVATAFSELWDSDSTNNSILTKAVVR